MPLFLYNISYFALLYREDMGYNARFI